MLSKESKITVLENFYGIDYALFGKPVSRVESCCPLLKEDYLAIKGALLSVYIEMIKLIEHEPTRLKEVVDSGSLKLRAKSNAKIAREYAERIVKSTKARQDIKESLKEAIKENANIDVSYIVENVIRQKAMALSVDSLLVAKALNESVEASNLNTWEGTLLEDSYKILRDNLIESAWQITDTYDEPLEEKMDGVTKAAIGVTAATTAATAGGYIYLRRQCKKSFPNDQEKFKKCVSMKKKNAHYGPKSKNESQELVDEAGIQELSANAKSYIKAGAKGAVQGAVVGGAVGLTMRKLRCKQLYKDDPEKAKACFSRLVGKLEPKEKK